MGFFVFKFMGALTDSVGLLFRIQAKDEASAEIKKLEDNITGSTSKISKAGSAELDKLTGSLGGATESFTALGGSATEAIGAIGIIAAPAVLAAGAIAAIGAASVYVAKTLFDLTKQASDYGSEIKDASDKTGLATETLSAMKLAADQSGTSLDQITSATARFAKGVASGTLDLKAFGLTPKQAIADLDGALGKVFATIAKTPTGIEQMTLAQKAFGKSSADLLPFIKQFDGDLPGLIAKAKELGITLSEQDANAADDFGDSMAELSLQAKGLTFQFAKELLPIFTEGLKDLSRFFTANKSTIQEWGASTASVIRGVVTALKEIVQYISDHPTLFRVAAAVLTLGGSEIAKATGENIINIGKSDISIADQRQRNDSNSNKPKPVADFDTDKAKKDAEKLARENAEGREKINKAIADGDKEAFEKAQELWVNYYKNNTALAGAFRDEYLRNEASFTQKQIQLTSNRFDIEISQEKNAVKQKALEQERRNEIAKLNNDSQKRIADAEKLITDTQKKETDKRVKLSEDGAKREIEIDRAKTQTRIAAIEKRGVEENRREKDTIAEIGLAKQDSINDEIKTNQKLLNNSEITGEKRAEIETRIAVLTENLKTEKLNTVQAISEAIQKETKNMSESAEKAAEVIARVKDEILKTENDLAAFQNEQKRKSLVNTADFSFGKDRLTALIALRDFDLAENERQRQAEIKEAQSTHDIALSKVKDTEKEKDLVEQINKLLTERTKIINSNHDAENGDINKDFKKPITEAERNSTNSGSFGSGLFSGLGQSVITETDAAGNAVTNLGNIFKEMGGLASQALTSIAQGLGSMLNQLILTGNLGGQSLKKLVASILASVSAQAAVLSIMELAYGIAALTPWGLAIYGNPVAHFQASALMAGVAVASGIAGRLTAGNSFSGSASANSAVASSTASNNSSSSSTTEKDRTITENRVQRQQSAKDIIQLQFPKGMIDRSVVDAINNRTEVHGAIVKVVVENA